MPTLLQECVELRERFGTSSTRTCCSRPRGGEATWFVYVFFYFFLKNSIYIYISYTFENKGAPYRRQTFCHRFIVLVRKFTTICCQSTRWTGFPPFPIHWLTGCSSRQDDPQNRLLSRPKVRCRALHHNTNVDFQLRATAIAHLLPCMYPLYHAIHFNIIFSVFYLFID